MLNHFRPEDETSMANQKQQEQSQHLYNCTLYSTSVHCTVRVYTVQYESSICANKESQLN